MATKKSKSIEDKKVEVVVKTPDGELTCLDTDVISKAVIAPNIKTHTPLEACTIRELLDLTEVSLILGKKYENLAIAEGQIYFHKKQEFNDLYNKIIVELEHRAEQYL